MKVSEFLNKTRWLEGPAFLWRPEEDWPKTVLDISGDSDDQEVRKEVMVNAISVCDISSPTDQLIAFFSDWRRLKTAVAWILRLKVMLLAQSCKRKQLEAPVTNCPEKRGQGSSKRIERKGDTSTFVSGSLTLDDLLGAEGAIIRYCQRQRFGEEMSALSSGKGSVSRQSPIYRLDPVLED